MGLLRLTSGSPAIGDQVTDAGSRLTGVGGQSIVAAQVLIVLLIPLDGFYVTSVPQVPVLHPVRAVHRVPMSLRL